MLTLATCSNARFFGACLTLIDSAQKKCKSSVSKILVYDLGLTAWQRALLNDLLRVEVVDFPEEITRLYPHFFNAKGFAWKQCIWLELYQLKTRSLYLDSGIEVLQDLSTTEELIRKDGILLVEDPSWRTADLTHRSCLKAMKASQEEKDQHMLCSGIVGIDPDGPYLPMFQDAFKYSKQKECLLGSSQESPKKHRQDQSILSVLSTRYHCPKQPLDIYAQWEWDKAKKDSRTILHVHRKRKGIRDPRPISKAQVSAWGKIRRAMVYATYAQSRDRECRQAYTISKNA